MKLKQKIKEIIGKVNPEIYMYEGDNLVGDMGIDSHDIFNIVIDLEEEFDIEIEPIYLKSSNFSSLEKIEKMILTIKGCKDAGSYEKNND